MGNIIKELLQQYKTLHFSLIDPDKQTPEEAGRRAKICADHGTNAIVIEGATVKNRKIVHDTVEAIKMNTEIPIIQFLSSTYSISDNIDYIFFPNILNSKDPDYKYQELAKSALTIKKLNIQTISTGYIILGSSEKLISHDKKVPLHTIQMNDINTASEYSIFSELSGVSCLFLEVNAKLKKPISNEMIQEIRRNINIPIIISGGITNKQMALDKINAGADVIVNTYEELVNNDYQTIRFLRDINV